MELWVYTCNILLVWYQDSCIGELGTGASGRKMELVIAMDPDRIWSGMREVVDVWMMTRSSLNLEVAKNNLLLGREQPDHHNESENLP